MTKTNYLSGCIFACIILLSCFASFASAQDTSAMQEEQMLELINDERLKYGIGPLILNPVLTQVARDHNKEMIEMDYFSHDSYDGSAFWERIKEGGYPLGRVAENIAMNYPPDVVKAHQNLMNSPGHRVNILNPDYNEIGIGIWVGEYSSYPDTAMYTQDFGWNQNTEIPFSITSFEPSSDIILEDGEEQLLSIVANDVCSVSWSVNGTIVQTDEDVTRSSYNIKLSSEGEHDIEVTAVNFKGEDAAVTWMLEVVTPESVGSIKGDFNGDGDVDFDDFVEFAAFYNSIADKKYSPVFDFDDDGDIDFDDFVEFAAVYNV